jgi:hypothetical protein
MDPAKSWEMTIILKANTKITFAKKEFCLGKSSKRKKSKKSAFNKEIKRKKV